MYGSEFVPSATCSRAHDGRASSARSTSTTFVFTTIWEAKSAPEARSRYSCVLRAQQYTHRCRQPRVGLIVQVNGIEEFFGTRFSALLHSTSWNVTPSNSGVRTLRTRPLSGSNAGPVPSVSFCPSHRITSFEHIFES